MKSNILYIALLAGATGILTSCGRDPAPEEAAGQVTENGYAAIGVTTESSQTRGGVTLSEDSILSLGIFGYSTGTDDFDGTTEPNLLNNRLTSRTSNDGVLSPWSYSPLAYWPLDPAVKNTFFAYSPYQTEFPDGSFDIHSVTGSPYLYYKVPEMVSQQVDILYSDLNSDVLNINYGSNTLNPGAVRYTMKHALMWIRFVITSEKISGESDDAFYTVKEFNFTGGNIITAGLFNMATGTWSDADGMGYVDYKFDHLEDSELEAPVGETVPLTSLTGNALMIIPQNIIQRINLTSVYVMFTYNDGSANPSDTQFYTTMPFPDVMLIPGYVMTYIIKLSHTGAWIVFDSMNTIEEWQNDNEDREIDVM